MTTGKRIPTAAIKSLSSGYEIKQALGYPKCRCRGRPVGHFDERFLVKDEEGAPVAHVRYRILENGQPIQTGVTDSEESEFR